MQILVGWQASAASTSSDPPPDRFIYGDAQPGGTFIDGALANALIAALLP